MIGLAAGSKEPDFTVSAYNRTRLQCLKYKAPIEAIANHPKQNTKAGVHWPAGMCGGAGLDAGFRRHDEGETAAPHRTDPI